MRHKNARTKLGRTSSHRKALLRNLSIELIRHGRIRTTETKAKALSAAVAKVITLAKRGEKDLSARRRALQIVPDKDTVAKLFSELGPRYQNRPGGYTRIYKLGPRLGDAAPMAIIELVDHVEKGGEPPKQQQEERKPSFTERILGRFKGGQA